MRRRGVLVAIFVYAGVLPATLVSGQQVVEIAAVEVQSAIKQAESFFTEQQRNKHDVNYDVPEKGIAEGRYDPDGNLFKPLYGPYGRDIHGPNPYAPDTMIMPEYPSYKMYHPRKEYEAGDKDAPLLGYYPCCHYAPAQTIESVAFDLRARSPHQNCRALTIGFLRDHHDEHYYHRCTYGNPDGGPVNPEHNTGREVQRHNQPLGATIVGRGNCVNIYFNQRAGAVLAAPQVSANGECANVEKGRRPPRMDFGFRAPGPPQGSPHFERRLQQHGVDPDEYGYDYILDCTCLCEEMAHTGRTHARTSIGY